MKKEIIRKRNKDTNSKKRQQRKETKEANEKKQNDKGRKIAFKLIFKRLFSFSNYRKTNT